jgi:dUTP pyrophosphatase
MWTTNEDYYATIVNFVKLSPTAQEPTHGSDWAAGYDLHADLEGANRITLAPGEVRKISSGIAIALPRGTFGALYPRSGNATKRGLVLANTVGIVDADYRGPVIIALKNTSDQIQIIEQGERIAQLIVQPFNPVLFNEVESIGTTARGNGGFGSSGTK